MDKNAWLDHPGRNPAHRFEGRERGETRVPDLVTGKVKIVKWVGPRNPSRWLPHQGVQEAVRRAARTNANG